MASQSSEETNQNSDNQGPNAAAINIQVTLGRLMTLEMYFWEDKLEGDFLNVIHTAAPRFLVKPLLDYQMTTFQDIRLLNRKKIKYFDAEQRTNIDAQILDRLSDLSNMTTIVWDRLRDDEFSDQSACIFGKKELPFALARALNTVTIKSEPNFDE